MRDDTETAANRETGLESILDAMPCATVLVEVGSGRIVFANRAAAIASLERASAADARLGYYATDPGGARIVTDDAPIRRAARGETFQAMQIAWHTPRGRRHFLVSSDLTAAAAAAGRRPGLAVVTFLDVTHLEAAQAELRQLLHARDEFLSVVTHELKEPLNSMLLALQLVQAMHGEGAAAANGEVREQLQAMRRQGNRLARLVENLLDVSRATHGLVYLDPEALDLCALVREVVERFRRDDPLAAETLSLVACEPTIGYFDRTRIDQVLGNLLINALKYGAARPIEVRVSADDETATLEVADHGIGIDPADQGRVFDRFERATNGHRRSSLGLGLYIVRAIVEAHGGDVRLQSEVGRGSTFTVTLPRRRLRAAQAPHGDGTG
jgi:signal transduction histidine kinase